MGEGYHSAYDTFSGEEEAAAAAAGPALDEQFASLDGWTKENTGNRGIVTEESGYFSAKQGTTDAFVAERNNSIVCPSEMTVDFDAFYSTGGTFDEVQIGCLMDSVTRDDGLVQFSDDAEGEDGIVVAIGPTYARIYDFDDGSRVLRDSGTISLTSGNTASVRFRLIQSGGTYSAYLYVDSTLEASVEGQAIPAGVGADFMIGAEAVSIFTESHIGNLQVYYSDKGAP